VIRAPMRALLIMVQLRPLGILIYLFTGVLLCLHAPNQAEAAGSFAERLAEAIRQVEAAREHGTSLGDPSGLFPETEEVMGPGGSVRVDHASLREEWRAVPAGGPARRESLERLRHRLVAVRAEMASTQFAAVAGASPPAGWQEKLSEVMSRTEFKKRQLEEDWRDRLLQWLREKLGLLLPRSTREAIGSLGGWILYGLAGVTLAVILVVLVRAALPLLTSDRSGSRGLSPSGPKQPETQETLLALADASTRAGDFRGAARAIFRWMLLGLHRSGRLEYDPALTNREHLTRLTSEGGLRVTFEQLSNQFELIWYGFHPVAPEELAVFRAECQHLAGGRS